MRANNCQLLPAKIFIQFVMNAKSTQLENIEYLHVAVNV